MAVNENLYGKLQINSQQKCRNLFCNSKAASHTTRYMAVQIETVEIIL
jgi:hypothetical protein